MLDGGGGGDVLAVEEERVFGGDGVDKWSEIVSSLRMMYAVSGFKRL